MSLRFFSHYLQAEHWPRMSVASRDLTLTTSDALEWIMRAAAPPRRAPGAPPRAASTIVKQSHHHSPSADIISW